jgi:hypothetical protein
LAYFLTLKGDNEFEFPPHTPSNEARTPGLLHLSFSDKQNRRKELVFTDAPGEWFSEWAINEQSPKAAGARWINKMQISFSFSSTVKNYSALKKV